VQLIGIACSMFLAASAAPRQDSAAIVSMVRLAYPGSHVVFGRGDDSLVDRKGRAEQVHFRFGREDLKPVHIGALVVTFAARTDSAVARAERGDLNPGHVPSEVLVADLSPTDEASNLRRMILDDSAVGTTLGDLKISADPDMLTASAPHDTSIVFGVVAEYTSIYSGRGWAGGVYWKGVIEIMKNTLGSQQRYPEMFAKQIPPDTAVRIHGRFRLDDAEDGLTDTSIRFHVEIDNRGVQSSRTITLPWSITRPLSGLLLLSKF
jgi:hypothetical protein